MVQGTSYANESKVCAQNWEGKVARKTGYEAIQKRDQERRATEAHSSTSKKGQTSSGSGGAWGSFKSKDNFTNMHLC